MAKRSIEDYRPRGIALEAKYASKELVDDLILIAGSLPDRTFTVARFGTEPDTEVAQEVSARTYLRGILETAAMAYHYQADDSKKPTHVQLSKAYEDIRRHANDLLLCLQVAGKDGVGLDNMPYALRFGALRDEAWEEAKRLQQAAEAKRLQGQRIGQRYMADTLLREAIRGVDQIRRWGAGAHNREQRALGTSRKANEGDVALNNFLRTVALHCWKEACDQPLRIGPRLVKFVRVAAKAINRNLSDDDDAVMKQLQRAVGLKSTAD